MNNLILYCGWFIEPTEVKGKLAKKIEFPHITLQYKPTDYFPEYFGTKARIKVVGYGNNGTNEGYLCEVEPDNDFLKQELKKVKTPHITLSVSKNGKPVDTANLDFEPIEPFELVGIYGGFPKF